VSRKLLGYILKLSGAQFDEIEIVSGPWILFGKGGPGLEEPVRFALFLEQLFKIATRPNVFPSSIKPKLVSFAETLAGGQAGEITAINQESLSKELKSSFDGDPVKTDVVILFRSWVLGMLAWVFDNTPIYKSLVATIQLFIDQDTASCGYRFSQKEFDETLQQIKENDTPEQLELDKVSMIQMNNFQSVNGQIFPNHSLYRTSRGYIGIPP